MIKVNFNDGKDVLVIKFTHDVPNRETICRVGWADEEHTLGFGRAVAHHTDQFNKAIGRKVALTRALTQFDRYDRKKIWDTYWGTGAKKS